MRERPILFSAPMVRAILEGRKTQTRRIIKPQPSAHTFDCACLDAAYPEKPWCWLAYWLDENGDKLSSDAAAKLHGGWPDCGQQFACPYGTLGDRLWVKEAWTGSWHPTRQSETNIHIAYAADGGEGWRNAPDVYRLPKAAQKAGNWVTPLFMPRWASRITVDIAEIRVQRLLEITESDAMAEGATPWEFGPEQTLTTGERGADSPYRSGFAYLWDGINAHRATWKSNPWVWAVTFKEVTA